MVGPDLQQIMYLALTADSNTVNMSNSWVLGAGASISGYQKS